MKRFNMKLLSIILMAISISFSSCEKDDDTAPTTNSQQNNGGGNSGGNTNLQAKKNTIVETSSEVKIINCTYRTPINSGSTNTDYSFEIFADIANGVKGYWVIGFHELPTASTTLTSDFSYHWQNLPQGKFYFSRVQDANGNSWWYTKNEEITMDVIIENDILTITCADIEVGNNFLPQNVDSTTTVSISASMSLSAIQNGGANGVTPLID